MRRTDRLDIPVDLADCLDRDRLALVVYDMQIGICSQLETEAVKAACARAIAAARAAGVRIAYMRHLSAPKAWMGRMAYRTAMAWQRTDDPAAVRPWFLRDTPGIEITPELAPTEDDLVIDKLTMSAFEGTPLAMALRDCGIIAVAFCGIALEIGIEPSLRHASDLGFVPILIEDAVGWGDQAAADRAFAQARFLGDTIVTDVAAFEAGLADINPSSSPRA
jgi:biuret amidohydrolase